MTMFYIAVPALAYLAMGFLLIVLLVRYFVAPFKAGVLPALAGPGPVKRRARKNAPLKDVLLTVGAAYIVSRALIFAAALIATEGGAFTDPLGVWMRWDAGHYVGLGRQWYVNEGDARLHIVFFPLYPLLIRAFYNLGADAEFTGVLISNICLLGAAWALYRLAELDNGARAGERAVWFLLFSPLSFFFSIAYSESLFIMLTLLAVLMARRRRFLPAVLLGALASGARLLGLLTAVPIFYEMLLTVRERKGGVKMALRYVLACAPVALGFLLYLYLNYRVTGDPLTFLTYQREHWSQSMGSLWNTLSYTLNNALNYGDRLFSLGTWIPQLLAILLSIALLALSYKRISPGDGAYALLYIYLAVSPTWLLSGPRYLTALYAVYPMLAVLTENKRAAFAVMAASCVATVVMVWLFVAGRVL